MVYYKFRWAPSGNEKIKLRYRMLKKNHYYQTIRSLKSSAKFTDLGSVGQLVDSTTLVLITFITFAERFLLVWTSETKKIAVNKYICIYFFNVNTLIVASVNWTYCYIDNSIVIICVLFTQIFFFKHFFFERLYAVQYGSAVYSMRVAVLVLINKISSMKFFFPINLHHVLIL